MLFNSHDNEKIKNKKIRLSFFKNQEENAKRVFIAAHFSTYASYIWFWSFWIRIIFNFYLIFISFTNLNPEDENKN